MNPDYAATGLRLKEARNKKQLTQKELADLAGVSVSYVKNTERGGKPSIEYLFSVSEICSVSVGWLLTGVQDVQMETEAQTQKVEAVFDPDLKRMIDVLKDLMESDNQNLRGWAIIQFENAFKEHCATLDQKKLHA